MRNCGGCLGIVDDWDSYCRFCGRPLDAPGQMPPNLDLQQRKFATILFADIVGSTSLVEGLPPEEAIARLGPAVGAMCSIVIRHGGTVCRDQGDGLMAVFGAPTAFSDHALRACRAGLEIVGGLDSDLGLAAHVRVGVHSGDIIFHHVYVSSGATYAVAGPAVHLASRLEAACRPGHVLISEATKLLVHGFVKTAGSVASVMKGFNEPVNTFELSAELPAGGWAARMNRGASPFVGRRSEIDQLTALADGCAASVAVACVRGDAGMGKSRLARQVVRRLGDSGWQAVAVESDADNTAVPYALLASFCLACIALPQEGLVDWPADVSSLFDGHAEAQVLGLALRTIRGVSVADHQWLALESGYRRRKMFEVALTLLQRRLRQRDKIVVLLEDLHWADRESLLVLGQLQQHNYDGKLYLLSTARPSDGVPDEQAWFQSGFLLDLLPFDMATSEHLLDELLGRSSELMRLKGRVLQKAGGNPMLLEEVVRWLVGSGHVQGELGNHRLASSSEDFVVPDSVRSIVLARVDQLTEPCKATLRAAAILGSQFSIHQLASMLGNSVADVLMQIEDLLSASMLVPVGGAQRESDTYGFGHAIFQDCVVSALTLGTRQQLHQRALESCVASDGASGADLAERISRHAIEARDWVRVALYSMRAGQKAMERLAYLDAAVFFERAIDALYRLPRSAENVRLAIDARLQVRISYSAASRLDLCLKRIEEAEQLCSVTGDPRRLVCRVFRAAVINFVGHPRHSILLARPALKQAVDCGDVQTAALAVYVMGQAHFGAGRFAQCAEVLRGAEALLVGEHEGLRVGTTGTMSVMCLGLRIAALGALGHFSQARQLAARAAAIAARTGRTFDRVALLFGTGSMQLKSGQPQCAVFDLEEAMHLCRLHAIDSFVTAVAIPLGESLSVLGRHLEAIETLQGGLEQARRLGHLSQSAQLQSQLGLALTRVGRPAEASSLAAECIERSTPYGFMFSQAISHYVLALASDATQTVGASLPDYERACRLCLRLQAWPTLAQILLSKAEVLRRSGANRRSAAALAQYRRVVALCEPSVHLQVSS